MLAQSKSQHKSLWCKQDRDLHATKVNDQIVCRNLKRTNKVWAYRLIVVGPKMPSLSHTHDKRSLDVDSRNIEVIRTELMEAKARISCLETQSKESEQAAHRYRTNWINECRQADARRATKYLEDIDDSDDTPCVSQVAEYASSPDRIYGQCEASTSEG
jgi:hypothetical protein